MSSASDSPRFGFWVSFYIISIVTLGAVIEARARTDRLSPAAQTNQKFAVACCAILLLLSLVVVILHTRPLLSSVIVGTKVEGGIILVLLTLSSALVAIVSDTRHGLATDSSGSISNGNLYYFSWAGFATGVVLMLSYVRSVWGIDVTAELQYRAKRLKYWVWLAIIGLIQMGSSARLFDNHCGRNSVGLGEAEMGTVKFCRRCKLGIVVGIFSSVPSMAVSGVKIGSKSANVLTRLYTAEMVLSGIVVTIQAVGVALLTSREGPGAPLNDVFYSSWGSLIVGLILVASCVEDWSSAKGTLYYGTGVNNNHLGEEGHRIESREGHRFESKEEISGIT